MNSHESQTGSTGGQDIPAAFYRDTPPPMPPPDDPHRVEFDIDAESDDLPSWMLVALPAVVPVVFLLHAAVAVIILLLVR